MVVLEPSVFVGGNRPAILVDPYEREGETR